MRRTYAQLKGEKYEQQLLKFGCHSEKPPTKTKSWINSALADTFFRVSPKPRTLLCPPIKNYESKSN